MSNSYWLTNEIVVTNNATIGWGPATVVYPSLPSVTDDRYRHKLDADRALTEREWLDAQIDDVCALAAI